VDVADWLSSIVEAGGKFSRFDNFRSSVCVFLDLLSGSVARMADTPLVKSVSRAAATDMPRAPKYSECVDLGRVGPVSLLGSDGEDDHLAHDRLSRALLRLGSMGRLVRAFVLQTAAG